MFPQLLQYRDATTIMASVTSLTIYRFRFNNINETYRGGIVKAEQIEAPEHYVNRHFIGVCLAIVSMISIQDFLQLF